ncbi:MAG: flagellar biosynthesis protein [Proteobacteria bacterium]|nr:flagellar biosynthesis protein [Pseudomonadota bacterium]
MSDLPFVDLARSSGFVADPRFVLFVPDSAADAADPLQTAWDDGFAAGQAQAEAAAHQRAADEAAAQQRIELSLSRLNDQCEEELRRKLIETVEALCEASLAPLAIDTDALAARAERAAAMLSRADDDRVLRLNPDDLALVAARLPPGLELLPDPALERGALRLEGSHGGIEDGPGHWRSAIAQALAQC